MRNQVRLALIMGALCGSVGYAQDDLGGTVQRVGVDLGLYRGFKGTDFIIASQFDASGTMLVDGRMVPVPRYRSQIRWDVGPLRR